MGGCYNTCCASSDKDALNVTLKPGSEILEHNQALIKGLNPEALDPFQNPAIPDRRLYDQYQQLLRKMGCPFYKLHVSQFKALIS